MKNWNPIRLDAGENTLILSPGDEDGFHIEEENGSKGKVYVYYSEKPNLIKCLEEVPI